jgi:hypothetical protein
MYRYETGIYDFVPPTGPRFLINRRHRHQYQFFSKTVSLTLGSVGVHTLAVLVTLGGPESELITPTGPLDVSGWVTALITRTPSVVVCGANF